MSLLELNNLRLQNNKSPLKAWKESKAKLEAAIEKEIATINFEAPVAEIAQQVIRPMHPDASSLEGIREIVPVEQAARKVVKEGKVTKDNKSRPGTSSSPVEPFFLADVARALKIDPKLARVKARRHLTHLQISPDAWSFKATNYDAVVAILTSDARKK